jgi:hypothetical protein
MNDEISGIEVPPGHRICGFCGSVVAEAQYAKHRKILGQMPKKCVKGSVAAYRRARNAAKARWAKYRENSYYDRQSPGRF